ncbi:DUF4013 domain-containing protein [Methanobrevibacter sp.]|uniref:DUF4013 domain-containing protein n=1 Tax=Methanobrevibacter sp. TaxID=66852 RepID=UPI00388EC4A6
MAGITDCVSEGLKYPFKDIKKILSLGILFTIINVIAFAILEKTINIVRIISHTDGNNIALKISQLPSTDIYIIAGLAIISFIVVLIINGYQYRVINFAIGRKTELPEFNKISNLLVNGLKYFLVSLIYNIIPIIVMIAGFELQSIQNGDYIISIISMILFIICNLLLIMALANMVDNDKFTKAFDLKEISDKISALGWVKYIGIILFAIIVYCIIMLALGIVLMFITMFIVMTTNQVMIIMAILSVIGGLFINSYICIFFNRVYGSVYNEAIK